MKKFKKAIAFMLSVVMIIFPLASFAEDSSDICTIIDLELEPYLGNGDFKADFYTYNGKSGVETTLSLYGWEKFSFEWKSDTPKFDDLIYLLNINYAEIVGGEWRVKLAVNIDPGGVISGGTFRGDFLHNKQDKQDSGTISGGIFDIEVINDGTISGGEFNQVVSNSGTISNGTFNELVTNNADGEITGGTFPGKILNYGGAIVNGIEGTVAEAGDLAIGKKYIGTGTIAIKQNGVDIPSGAAGEKYNLTRSEDLIGLYMLKEGDDLPEPPYSIDDQAFTAAFFLQNVVQYDFTMPDEPITIYAVFEDYAATEYSITSCVSEGGKATASVSIPTSGKYTVLFIDYTNGALNRVEAVTENLPAGKVTVTTKNDIALGAGDKVMLWSGMDSMRPLCPAYPVTVAQ